MPAGGATSIATPPSLPRASARQGVTPSGMAPGGRAGLGSPGCGPKRMPRHAGRSERRSDRGFLAGVQPRRPPPRRVAEPGHRLPAARGRDPRRETAGASRHRPAPSRPRLPAARPRRSSSRSVADPSRTDGHVGPPDGGSPIRPMAPSLHPRGKDIHRRAGRRTPPTVHGTGKRRTVPSPAQKPRSPVGEVPKSLEIRPGRRPAVR